MKKITSIGSVLLVVFNLIPSLVSADIPPENSHPYERCVRIVNVNDFPDIVVIGTSDDMTGKKSYPVVDNSCLIMGYKLGGFTVSWTTREKLNPFDSSVYNTDPNSQLGFVSTGLIKTLNPAKFNISDSTILSKDIYPGGRFVPIGNPMIGETIEYSLGKDANGTTILSKSKVTTAYNDGTPQKVEIFSVNSNSQDTITLNPNGITKSSSKADIINLQKFLNRYAFGLTAQLVTDGKYGAKTTAAIKIFQSSNQLKSDGVFGKLSAKMAMDIVAIQR